MKAVGFFLGLCLWICPASADMYLVRDIPVDVTDENATIAREKAITEAQERGFYQLLERLTVPADMKDLPVLTTEDMLNLVQDYSVANEKTSSVRYIADVSVQFNPEAIQTFFQEYHVPYITSSADRSLIFPVYRPAPDAPAQLWQEDNPWLQVWQNEKVTGDLVPLVVPIGDLTDQASISQESLSDEMMLDITPLYRRYQALSALMVEADVDKRLHQVKITIRPFQNERSYVGIISFFEPLDAPLKTVLKRAGQRTIPLLEKKWREQNAVRFDNPSSLVTIVPIQNLAEWIQIRERLDRIKLIKQYVVKAVRKDQAQIEIFFAGDLRPFLETVKREGLFLSPAKGDLWHLRDLKDVPVDQINGMKTPSSARTIEPAGAFDAPAVSADRSAFDSATVPAAVVPADTDTGEGDADVVNVIPEIQPIESAPAVIPVMRMDRYQVIPSVTQPESAELLTSSPENGETP